MQKKIKLWIEHPPSGNVDVYHLPQRLCGLGVPNIVDLFEEAQMLATHTLTHSSNVQIQQLIGQERAQARASREQTAATQARFDAEHAADGDSKRRQTRPRKERTLMLEDYMEKTGSTWQQVLSKYHWEQKTKKRQQRLQTLHVQGKAAAPAPDAIRDKLTFRDVLLDLPDWEVKFRQRALTDTLPTPVNLRRWNKKVNPNCVHCGRAATLSHILNNCYLMMSKY